MHQLTVGPLPVWLDATRLLGFEPHIRALDPRSHEATLTLAASEAADVAARLRGLGIDGRPIELSITPPLARNHVRAARLRDARARRDTTPGFLHNRARVEGEGRYSLTPEVLALEMAAGTAGWHVLDACCGAGGNAIGFARAGARVTAIDVSAERLAEARHNASVYEVADRIQFIAGDAREISAQHTADLLFVDAPWGRDFDKQHTDVHTLPLLAELLPQARRYRQWWTKVPSSFETSTLGIDVTCTAFFGRAAGDFHRIKFVLVRSRSA